MIPYARQIVKNATVLYIVDIVTAVSPVIGETHVIHSVQYIVSKESVIKSVVAVHRDARRDNMETRVITHVVLGVLEGHVTNKVQSVLMDVCRTGQGLNVTVRFTIIKKQANQIYMLTFVTHIG